ncbi:TPA: hypothetical protein DIU27_05690 [Candidatus Collierbacteria bacterium]|nr:hypothetical protein [Candidatus Collierbacteria bacterium]
MSPYLYLLYILSAILLGYASFLSGSKRSLVVFAILSIISFVPFSFAVITLSIFGISLIIKITLLLVASLLLLIWGQKSERIGVGFAWLQVLIANIPLLFATLIF